jgi:hypothetical protein
MHIKHQLQLKLGRNSDKQGYLPGTSQKHRQRQLGTNSVAPASVEESLSTAKGGRKRKQTNQGITSVAIGEQRHWQGFDCLIWQ